MCEFRIDLAPNGWPVGRFDALESLPVRHMVTTRQGLDVNLLVSDRAAAAAKIAEAMGLEGVAFLKQVHGNSVLVAAVGGEQGAADGLVTEAPSLGIMAVSADCPLILAAHVGGSAVGVAHASWRGTARQMAVELIAALWRDCSARPEEIVACICPSAGPQKYQVGPEVRDEMLSSVGPHADAFFLRRDGKLYFDLWAANRDQLIRAGLSPANVHIAGICTITRNDLFPSYRIEGDQAGRFAAVIARR